MGAVSNAPFQHMTEPSHCNHTHSFLSTQKKRKTTWENYNCPTKTLPTEDRWFPGKTQALGCKFHFPFKNTLRYSCCSMLIAHVPCHFPIHSSLRLQGSRPRPRHASSGAQRNWFSASSSSVGPHPCIVHLGMAGIPQVPQSHDCWQGGQQARGTEGFPSLASPHNLGSAKDNRLPGNAAGPAETGLARVLLLQPAQHPRGRDLHPPGAFHIPAQAPVPQTVLQI